MRRLAWWFLFGVVALYVAARMGGFALDRVVEAPGGSLRLPDTFATVDHPFHVARAETLWRATSAGELLRWVSQHQGGYPVEFYPLGEAWLELTIRAAALGALSAGSAHTVAVIVIFLLPGVAFAALGRSDGWSPAVALLALALHVGLPGGWYDGGYTELVQWGLVTNVAGAVAALLMFPAQIRYLASGAGWTGALAALLAAMAIYCNPRSLVALLALGGGAWLASLAGDRPLSFARQSSRLALVALATALLTAPELLALARFRGLYAFVHYSGYDSLADYALASLNAVGWLVILLTVLGLALAAVLPGRLALRSTTVALVIYVALTAFVAFAPMGVDVASQLEPTRLMPLQRLLMFYLAAAAVAAVVDWLRVRSAPGATWVPAFVTAVIAGAVLLVLTRPMTGPPPDPASSVIPAVSLYPVERAGQPAQVELESAVRRADAEAEPETAILILGSALSWHQPLWAPLWTTRPLYYDNWLWYWHARHAGTPGYRPLQGHHYPDPEMTLDHGYLARHGIGAVVVTGRARAAAASSSLLRSLDQGIYDTYLVRDPVTTITFGAANAANGDGLNQWFLAETEHSGQPVIARQNWFPRWTARVDRQPAAPAIRSDGYMTVTTTAPVARVEFLYAVQPLDWLARGLAAAGAAIVLALILWRPSGERVRRHWYSPASAGAPGGPAGRSAMGSPDAIATKRESG